MVRPTVHEELGQVEQVFVFCSNAIDGASFVHICELSLRNVFVEVVIELPHHPFYLFLAHFGPQPPEDDPNLELGEVPPAVGGC